MGNLETYSTLEWKYHKDVKMGLLGTLLGKLDRMKICGDNNP